MNMLHHFEDLRILWLFVSNDDCDWKWMKNMVYLYVDICVLILHTTLLFTVLLNMQRIVPSRSIHN